MSTDHLKEKEVVLGWKKRIKYNSRAGTKGGSEEKRTLSSKRVNVLKCESVKHVVKAAGESIWGIGKADIAKNGFLVRVRGGDESRRTALSICLPSRRKVLVDVENFDTEHTG